MSTKATCGAELLQQSTHVKHNKTRRNLSNPRVCSMHQLVWCPKLRAGTWCPTSSEEDWKSMANKMRMTCYSLGTCLGMTWGLCSPLLHCQAKPISASLSFIQCNLPVKPISLSCCNSLGSLWVGLGAAQLAWVMV